MLLSHRHHTLVLLAAALFAALAGCQRASRLQLAQPYAPPAQQDMELASTWAYYADYSGRRDFLLEFPLPGSNAGLRAFRVFISLPGPTGEHAVRATEESAARGFFLQEVGDLAGKSVFETGVAGSSFGFLSLGGYRLDLELTGPSGMRLTGRAYPVPNPRALRAFRGKHAADIAALHAPPASQPGEPDEQGLTELRAERGARPDQDRAP